MCIATVLLDGHGGIMDMKEAHTEQCDILLWHDLGREDNPENTLSDGILDKCFHCLKHFKQIGEQYGVQQHCGIGTAVFRKASNGVAFLERVKNVLGIDIRLVSQEEEGRIGSLTALSVSSVKDEARLLAWDSGGGSFQLIHQGFVYKGAFGSSSTALLMKQRIRKGSSEHGISLNPVSFEEAMALSSLLQQKLASLETPPWIEQCIRDDTLRIVGIGGNTSAFRMASIGVGSTTISRANVLDLMKTVCGKEDFFLESKYVQVGLLIPKLVLLYSVMSHFNIPAFEYCSTVGCTQGLMYYEQLWHAR